MGLNRAPSPQTDHQAVDSSRRSLPATSIEVRRRRKAAHVLHAQSGAVYVEFVIVFIPIMLIWMAIMQLALFSVARLTVQHAAIRGVRAAVVILDDDPQYYNDVPRNCLTGGKGNMVDGFIGKLASTAIDNTPDFIKEETGINRDSLDRVSSRFDNAGPRMQSVRNAVYTPLLTLAPDARFLWKKESMRLALGYFPATRLLSGIVYNRGAAAVTFPSEPGAEGTVHEVPKRGNITVRVTYLYHCAVPLVSALMCSTVSELLGSLTEGIDNMIQRVRDLKLNRQALTNYRPPSQDNNPQQNDDAATQRKKAIAKDMAHAELPALQLLFGAHGQRFKVFRMEATLPNQSGKYKYQSEKQRESEDGDASEECAAPERGKET